ncbi:hypothetical protein [Sphingobium lignivorans]|uniref:Uncharacterized protein n=1 Tax=Sphingobium lignivorans TaxID=2735886 RepID=A0ABR6NAF5_9SPHN|nr:hypothetical protein [Sphingobium lignivorans]MBB5984242.1 hypothetical protein [Sphingobium lignivorans]
MTKVDGAYDCITKTPMGEQPSVFTIVTDGARFNGTNAGPLGSLDVKDGKVDGNRLSWTMEMTMPMPMTLKCEAVVNEGTITGTIDAGAFGTLTMSGTRRG